MSLGQNDRSRGRQTNRGREPNPLTRSYDSHGPDVRIRGSALHVAERYLQLARDAHTGNNPIAAENYLQHAEHYFRWRCHGVGGLLAEEHDENQLLRISVPSGNHSPGDLALSPVHA